MPAILRRFRPTAPSMNWTDDELESTKAGAKAAGLKKPRKIRDDPEKRLQLATALEVAELRKRGWLRCPTLVYHVASESMDARRRAIMSGLGVIRGVPDWFLGWGVVAELKAGRNDLTPAQRAFRDQWEAAGGKFFICRKLDQFTSLLYLLTTPDVTRAELADLEADVRHVIETKTGRPLL